MKIIHPPTGGLVAGGQDPGQTLLEDHRQGVEFPWNKNLRGLPLGDWEAWKLDNPYQSIYHLDIYTHTHIYIYTKLDTILIILFLIGRRQFTSNLRLGVVPTSQRAALPRLFVQLLPDNSDRDHATMSWRILRQIQWWSIPKHQPFNDDIIPMVSWKGLTFNDGILGMVCHQIQRYHQLGLLLMINHPNLRSILVPNNDPRKGINSYWRYHWDSTRTAFFGVFLRVFLRGWQFGRLLKRWGSSFNSATSRSITGSSVSFSVRITYCGTGAVATATVAEVSMGGASYKCDNHQLNLFVYVYYLNIYIYIIN